MKKTIFPILGLMMAANSLAQTCSLTVTVLDIKKAGEGILVFQLFDQEDGFPRETAKAFMVGKQESFQGTAVFTFENVPYGSYALSIFQDLNENGAIDSNFMGIPKEPVGASNMTSFSRPTYSKSLFSINQPVQKLELRFIMN